MDTFGVDHNPLYPPLNEGGIKGVMSQRKGCCPSADVASRLFERPGKVLRRGLALFGFRHRCYLR